MNFNEIADKAKKLLKDGIEFAEQRITDFRETDLGKKVEERVREGINEIEQALHIKKKPEETAEDVAKPVSPTTVPPPPVVDSPLANPPADSPAVVTPTATTTPNPASSDTVIITPPPPKDTSVAAHNAAEVERAKEHGPPQPPKP